MTSEFLSFVFVSVTAFEIFTGEKIFAYLHHRSDSSATIHRKSFNFNGLFSTPFDPTQKLESLSEINPQNLDSESQTNSTPTKQDSDDTQRPETLLLAPDTQDVQDTDKITDSPTTNVDKIQETPTTSIPCDTLQTVLQKLTTTEENTSKVLSSITAIEDRLKRMDSRMDLTETRLSLVERDMATIKTKHDKLDCNIFDLCKAVKEIKADADAIKTTHTHLKNYSIKLATFQSDKHHKFVYMSNQKYPRPKS